MEGKLFRTLDNAKPSFGEGISGILYAWQNTNAEFDDSYLFMKVRNLHKTYTHPLTERSEKPNIFPAQPMQTLRILNRIGDTTLNG